MGSATPDIGQTIPGAIGQTGAFVHSLRSTGLTTAWDESAVLSLPTSNQSFGPRLSPPELDLMSKAEQFCRREVGPHGEAWEASEDIPREVFTKASRLGLLGLTAPQEYGGKAVSMAVFARIIQLLASHNASLALNIAVHNTLGVGHILHAGTARQQAEYLPRLVSGEWLVAWALTEPSAGSDSGALRTRAVETPSGWELSGQKTFITGGRRADLMIVMAVTDFDQNGKNAVSAFLVRDRDRRFSRRIATYGMRASDTAEVHLDSARGELLGQRGGGHRDALALLDRGRIGIASIAIGIARSAMDAATRHTLQRVQFGKPIADYQAIQWMLADSATELDAADLLTARAASMQDLGFTTSSESAMAKLFASEAATRACNRAMQIHGGQGYTRACPAERFLRDVKLCEIAEGTSEIQRIVIARHVRRRAEDALALGPEPVVFREGTLEDAEQIARLFKVTYAESSHPCKDADFLKSTFTTGNDAWYVATQGKAVVACTANIRHPWNGAYETCRSITLPEFRGSGLGTRLYKKSLEETCNRHDCELTFGFPRSLAMYKLMSYGMSPALVLVGHDGGMNVANGKREYHLMGMTGSGRSPLRRVAPPDIRLANAQFIVSEILSPLGIVSETGAYPSACFVGPPGTQAITQNGVEFQFNFESAGAGNSLQLTGLEANRAGVDQIAAALEAALSHFPAAQHVSAHVLADKRELIARMCALGFALTAYLPAWHRDAGKRYDTVVLVKRRFPEEPAAHGSGEIIARFDRELGRLFARSGFMGWRPGKRLAL